MAAWTRWLGPALQLATVALLAYCLKTFIVVRLLLSGACPVLLAVLLAAGCAGRPDPLAVYQQAIQNCVLSSGHPHAGPDNTILCGD